MRPVAICIALLIQLFSLFGQAQYDLLNNRWDAHWITHPDFDEKDIGVYHFQKTINLSDKPNEFVIHISADNRYKLFVNGEIVVFGPARGDLQKWRYETIDISSHLKVVKISYQLLYGI